jgi:hypothetical protein
MLRLWLLGNWWEQDAANAEFRQEDRHQERAPQLALRTSEAFEVRIEGTTSRALHRLGARHPFDSVFAPPAGLEPATGRLPRLTIPLIEDAIRFSHVKIRNHLQRAPRRSISPFHNLALLAFAFCSR